MIAVLAVPAYRRYFAGRAASQFGDRLVPVALAFAVLRATRSATALSLVLASESAGQLLFLLAGGVIADRCPRRALMVGCDLTQLCVTSFVSTFLLLAHASVPALAGAGAVQGAAAAVAQPAAAGLVPSLVPAGQLADANSLGQLSDAVTRVLGLAVAGALVAAGPGWAFAVDAATFAVSAVALARVRVPAWPARPARPIRRRPAGGQAGWRGGLRADLRTGWAAFRGCPWLRAVTLGSLLTDFAFAIFVVLGPVASLRWYHGALTWSVISATGAAGSVAGGLLTARLRPRHPMRWALPAGACFAFPALGLAARLPTAAVACAGPLTRELTAGPALGLAGVVMALPLLGLLAVPSVRSFEQSIE